MIRSFFSRFRLLEPYEVLLLESAKLSVIRSAATASNVRTIHGEGVIELVCRACNMPRQEACRRIEEATLRHITESRQFIAEHTADS